MFMFHSKRTRLIKQLLKARKKRPPSAASCITDETTASQTAQRNHSWFAGSEVAEEAPTKMVQLQTLLDKNLKTCQLEKLWATVRSAGKQHGGCVLMPRDVAELQQVLLCQYYRWADVKHANELRRLPTCRTAADLVYICVNPYHWSRLLQPETPPPPYSTCTLDRLKPEDRAPSEAPLVFREVYMDSLLTTSGDADTRNPRQWCTLAYWEMARRVGPLMPVDTTCINILGDAGGLAAKTASEGLSLHTLSQNWTAAMASGGGCSYEHGLYGQHGTFRYPNNGIGCCGNAPDSENEAVVKTRSKIGLGVTLSREDNRVWLYNRSDYPVFVNSLSLDECNPLSNPTLSNAYPIRLYPGYCMCIYDNNSNNICSRVFGGGPVDPNSIRLSFVKGWGANKYSRREITACPCWLEILLAPCR